MPSQPSYLRFPAVRGDIVSFVADDDVWLVAKEGGTARRLSADRAPASYTRLSPDGRFVAYTSGRDGLAEVHLVSTEGSESRRLSYFGDRFTRTIGWSEDGRVLAVTSAGEPFRSRTWAYAISVEDGETERLPYGPVTSIARGPGGAVVLGVNQSRSRGAGWKRYRGGTAASLWIDRDGSGTFEPFLAELAGQLEDPAFYQERVVFVSDHEGVGNLYSALPDGSDVTRHSDHADFYAKAASSDGTTVVYQSAGCLYRLGDLERDSEPERIEVELGSPRTGRARKVVKAEDELGEFSVDATGRASAAEARGELHWITHEKGPARRLAGGSGVRVRLPRAVGGTDGLQVVFVTDAEGEDALEVLDASGPLADEPRRIGAGEIGRVLELAVSPDAKRAAVATHDGRVLVADLGDGALHELDRSEHGDASGLSFSPDSRYLAFSRTGPEPLRQIVISGPEGALIEATPLRFDDKEPVWSEDGKFLAFLSTRTFDPVYDALVFDMSFAAGTRPYLLPLAATTPSPFDASATGRSRPGTEAKGGGGDDERVEVDLDPDGLSERVVPFPVEAGRYSRLRAAKGGFLWLSEPLAGVLGESFGGGEPPRARLVRYELDSSRESELVGALETYGVSGDGKVVVIKDRKSLVVLPADRKVEAKGPEPDPSRVSVDLSRVRLSIDPPLEWAQMYDEAARLMRDHYWIEDMAGVDWARIVERYRPHLDQIATRDDLSDLLWEVQGELGTSHAYEAPPERPVEAERRLGLLGADLERTDDGWRVAALLPSETSVRAARSPLRAAGAGVHVGDVIVAVDGRPVGLSGPGELLVGAAGKPVELTVREASSGETREVVVEPLEDERPLRYQAWVAGRRQVVHDASEGRVGYVHIPDMMGNGWAELHRDLRLEVDREALVVDVRDNGGGHLSELVLEKLSESVRGWSTARHVSQDTYPFHAPRGPLVMVTNEQAGSDGDIVTAGFRQRGLGPVVGTRTWGGVIGIDGRYDLVDGSRVTQPRYSFWFEGFGWDIENHGVDPDVEVTFPPEAWGDGSDPQLERAVALVLEALEARPAATPPDPSTRPSRAAPPLPPRG